MAYTFYPGDCTPIVIDPIDPAPPIEWQPNTITYPAANLYDPTVVVHKDGMGNAEPNVLYDPGVNRGRCLVLASDSRPNIVTAAIASNAGDPYKTLHGRLRVTTRVRSEYSFPAHWGICALQSSNSLIPGGGAQAYAVICDTVLGLNRVRLVQMTDGISGSVGSAQGSSYILLAETDDDAFPTGTFTPGGPADGIVTLMLEWDSDPARLKGTRVQAWYTQGAFDPGIQLADIVFTGAQALKPASVDDVAGAGVFMSMATNPIITYFDNAVLSL